MTSITLIGRQINGVPAMLNTVIMLVGSGDGCGCGGSGGGIQVTVVVVVMKVLVGSGISGIMVKKISM